MQTYTESTQSDQVSNPQDTLNAALIFARALSLIFKEDQGIVVDIQNGIKMGEGVEKVIVFKHNDQVHIYKCDDDLPEGTAVQMNEQSESVSE